MTETEWCPTKKLLEQHPFDPKATFTIAEDGKNVWTDNVNKHYSKITPSQLSQVGPNDAPSLYEVIETNKGYSVYLYLDIDYYGTDQNILDDFLHHFHKFLQINDTDTVLGTHYEIATNKYITNKISYHVKYNIIFENSRDILEQVVKPFIEFYPPAAKYIDKSVYGNFRLFRLLYSTKFNANNPMIPYGTSSGEIQNHLVKVLEKYPQTCLPFTPSFLPMQSNTADAVTTISDTVNVTNADIINVTNSKVSSNTIHLVKEFLSTQYPGITFKNIIPVPKSLTKWAFNINYDTCDFNCLIAPTVSHKADSNILSTFQYNHKKKVVKYMCHRPNCVHHECCNNFAFNLSRIHDTIKWSHTEHTPTEFPYPHIDGILAIKGRMGVGKTKGIIEYYSKYCSEDMQIIDKNPDDFILKPKYSTLIITHSRVLSGKYEAAFAQFGFQNYQNGNFNASRFIVCLDSLVKLKKVKWDYVFIDEVKSVMEHYDSTVMKKTPAVCSKFEAIMENAKHIVIMDAAVDTPIVQDVMNHFWDKKQTWIEYTYLHPSNRHAHIIFNNRRSQTKNMKMTALENIYNEVDKGKKIVVCSNTKKFTEEVQTFLKSKNNNIQVMVYNSDTKDSVVAKHSRDPHKHWNEYDVVIYSPTITAGVSYELDYFDQLVAYFKNSDMCSKVDLSIQQLYRVRKLLNGQMDIYMEMGTEYFVDAAHPIDDQEIDEYLGKHANHINSNFEIPFDEYENEDGSSLFKYKESSLSYKILKGIIKINNQSLVNFREIMYSTLKTDYNIPTTVTLFQPNDQTHLVEVIKLFEEYKEITNKNIPWSEKLIPQKEDNDNEYINSEFTAEESKSLRLPIGTNVRWETISRG